MTIIDIVLLGCGSSRNEHPAKKSFGPRAFTQKSIALTIFTSASTRWTVSRSDALPIVLGMLGAPGVLGTGNGVISPFRVKFMLLPPQWFVSRIDARCKIESTL
jgi:hypothetical protein